MTCYHSFPSMTRKSGCAISCWGREFAHYNYPAVSRLVHVTLNFAGICHQVLHSSVFQCCRVWCGEYGLYTKDGKKHISNNFMCSLSVICTTFHYLTDSLCTKWVRRSWVTCSCQAFLIPVAERGAAAGKFPTLPPTDPSGISWLKTEKLFQLNSIKG